MRSSYLLLIGFVLAACSTPAPTARPEINPYPGAYPPVTRTTRATPPQVTPNAAYPMLSPTATTTGIAIAMDRPLRAGHVEVRGQGPAGLPILIVDISLSGDVLGAGVIDSDGRFVIRLSSPLTQPNIIGVQVNPDVASRYDANARFACQDRCRDFPNVGLVYDYEVVTAP